MIPKILFARCFASIRDFFIAHDPGNLNLFYTLKVFFVGCFCSTIAWFLFGAGTVIWGALIPISIYFLHLVLSEKREIFAYFCLFIISSVFFVVIFSLASLSPAALIFVVTLTIFLTTIIAAYDLDLHKVLSGALINGLIASANAKPGAVLTMIWQDTIVICFSGFFAIFLFLFVNFRRYQNFLQKHFTQILKNLALLTKSLDKPRQFQAISQILHHEITIAKRALDARATQKNLQNDKNFKRALFYLYRMEDVQNCLSVLHAEITGVNSNFLAELKSEIIHNLDEIQKMLRGHVPRFHRKTLCDQDLAALTPSIANVIKIIHVKFATFRKSSEANYFAEVRPKKSLRRMFLTCRAAMNVSNEFFQFATKSAFATGLCLFIALFFHSQNGIWIVLACLYIIRQNTGELRSESLRYLFGGAIGVGLGITIVTFLRSTPYFLPLFALAVFFFIYLRMFAHILWAAASMLVFVMLFAIFNADYLEAINRIFDILMAFAVVSVIFFVIFPKYGGSDFFPNLSLCLQNLQDLHDFLRENLQNLEQKHAIFTHIQDDFLKNTEALDLSIESARAEHKIIKNKQAAEDALQRLKFLHKSGVKMHYFLGSTPTLPAQKELFANDLALLSTRYAMLARSLTDKNFYFKAAEDGRFVSTDALFLAGAREIFDAQNKLFLAVQKNQR